MTERLRRFVLWTFMSVLTLVLFLRGHGTFEKKASVAFLRENTPRMTVRISGNVVNPGTYEFPRDTDLETVIRMTVSNFERVKVDGSLSKKTLKDGDVVQIIERGKQHIDISVKNMKAWEMVVLGIPLDPNRLEVDDWESLPGIGPELALRIVRDRQENGDFATIKSLERVPGIGEKRVEQLRKYF